MKTVVIDTQPGAPSLPLPSQLALPPLVQLPVIDPLRYTQPPATRRCEHHVSWVNLGNTEDAGPSRQDEGL